MDIFILGVVLIALILLFLINKTEQASFKAEDLLYKEGVTNTPINFVRGYLLSVLATRQAERAKEIQEFFFTVLSNDLSKTEKDRLAFILENFSLQLLKQGPDRFIVKLPIDTTLKSTIDIQFLDTFKSIVSHYNGTLNYTLELDAQVYTFTVNDFIAPSYVLHIIEEGKRDHSHIMELLNG